MTRSLLLVLCITTVALAQSTQPATQPVDPAAVSKLVAELGDDDAKARETARGKLAAMGPGVLGELQKAADATADPEVRTSLQTLITELERADKSRPTLVSVNVKSALPQTVVEDIAKQAGVEIATWPDWVWRDAKTRVTIDAEKQPFWVVLSDVMEQAGLTTQGGHLGAGRIVLGNGNPGRKLPKYYRDGYLFVVSGASRSHSIDYGNKHDRNDSFNISMKALVDPKINAIKGPSHQLKVLEAIDDKGNSLKVGRGGDDGQLASSSWGANWQWDVSVPLQYKPEQGKTLKSLKGVASFLVAVDEEVWEVDLKNFERAERDFPGGKYSVEGVTPNANNPSVKIAITYRDGGLFGRRARSHENPYTDGSTVRTMLKLIDDKDRVYGATGYSGGGGGGKLSYDVQFNAGHGGREQAPGKPVKLVWSIPKSFKQVDVPVEFSDLPIP